MGAPWLDQPVMLHSSRADKCKLTTEQCALRDSHWLYWYQDDHTYTLPTIYFFIVAIFVFTVANLLSKRQWRATGFQRRPLSFLRFFAYRSFRIVRFGWLSPSVGVMVLGAIGSIYFFAMTFGPKPYYWPNTKTVSYGGSPPIATRTGFLALACLPFEMHVILILASKANMVTALTGVPHEKLQVYHRWVGWAMFVLALIHTFPFIIVHVSKGDMMEEWRTQSTYWTGVVALLAQAWLTFMSIGPIRNRFYETFKITHYIAIVVFLLFFFLHCDFRLSSWDYFIATAVLYTISLVYSQSRTYFEYGVTTATISTVTDHLVRVSMPVKFSWTPCQHVFIRFRGMGIHSLTTHPFTICSLPITSPTTGETTLTLYIKPAGGLTSRLATLASKSGESELRIFLDGPYGGLRCKTMARFDTSLLIAGGSGAGLTLPIIQDWILRREHEINNLRLDQKTVTSSLHVVLATRQPTTLKWYKNKVAKLCSQASEVVSAAISVSIHCTMDQEVVMQDLDVHPSDRMTAERDDKSTVDVLVPGRKGGSVSEDSICSTHFSRPDLSAVIRKHTSTCNISVGIVVCGPKSMLHDVRNAAAEAELKVLKGDRVATEVYLHSEPFSW